MPSEYLFHEEDYLKIFFVTKEQILACCRKEVITFMSTARDALQQKGIYWFLNQPMALHMGGVWERIVRTICSINWNHYSKYETN